MGSEQNVNDEGSNQEHGKLNSAYVVGHAVRRIVVPGSTLNEPRQVDVHLWYPASAQAYNAAPPTVYRSQLQGLPVPPQFDPLMWTIASEIAHEEPRVDPAPNS